MIFADNVLRVEHAGGFGIEFNALDALKCVDAHHDPLKVAVSEAWREARYHIFNLLYTCGLFHCYMLDKSICHFRGVGSILSLLFFFDGKSC